MLYKKILLIISAAITTHYTHPSHQNPPRPSHLTLSDLPNSSLQSSSGDSNYISDNAPTPPPWPADIQNLPQFNDYCLLINDSESDNDESNLLFPPLEHTFSTQAHTTQQSLSECKNDSEEPLSTLSINTNTKPRKIVRTWRYRKLKEAKEKKALNDKIIQRNIKRFLFANSLRKSLPLVGHAAVINAIENNDAQELKRLIEEKKCPVDAQWNGENALPLAAQDSKSSCLKVLLDNGANPNFKDIEGSSLLYLTSQNGDDACALLLKKAGACHTPARHLGKKVGDIIPMSPLEYCKNLTIDYALVRAYKQTVAISGKK